MFENGMWFISVSYLLAASILTCLVITAWWQYRMAVKRLAELRALLTTSST